MHNIFCQCDKCRKVRANMSATTVAQLKREHCDRVQAAALGISLAEYRQRQLVDAR